MMDLHFDIDIVAPGRGRRLVVQLQSWPGALRHLRALAEFTH